MVWWIVLAAVVVGLLVLALAVVAVVRRLPRLARAAAGLRRRQAQALELQERLLVLQARAERIATISAKRDE